MKWYIELGGFFITTFVILTLTSPVKEEGILILSITTMMLTTILYIPYKLMQKKENKKPSKNN